MYVALFDFALPAVSAAADNWDDGGFLQQQFFHATLALALAFSHNRKEQRHG